MAAGWVLIIDEDDAEARVLVALLVSIIFLVMRVSSRPLKRCVATRIVTTSLAAILAWSPTRVLLFCRAIDGVLMTAVELSLVLIYVCVLLIKTCYTSTDVCAAYGFGDNGSGAPPTTPGLFQPRAESEDGFGMRRAPLPPPKGAFEFFLFFGLSMILLQIIAGLMGLSVEAYVPKILLVARAHSVSPSVIMQRVLARRWAPSQLSFCSSPPCACTSMRPAPLCSFEPCALHSRLLHVRRLPFLQS